MLARLDSQLRAVSDARALLAVVHVLPLGQVVQRGAFSPIAFHDAWLGSSRLGARLQQEPHLQALIHGHQHRPTHLTLNDVQVRARPVGDAAHSDLSPDELAIACMGLLELDC